MPSLRFSLPVAVDAIQPFSRPLPQNAIRPRREASVRGRSFAPLPLIRFNFIPYSHSPPLPTSPPHPLFSDSLYPNQTFSTLKDRDSLCFWILKCNFSGYQSSTHSQVLHCRARRPIIRGMRRHRHCPPARIFCPLPCWRADPHSQTPGGDCNPSPVPTQRPSRLARSPNTSSLKVGCGGASPHLEALHPWRRLQALRCSAGSGARPCLQPTGGCSLE
jgi:hypothetical protein